MTCSLFGSLRLNGLAPWRVRPEPGPAQTPWPKTGPSDVPVRPARQLDLAPHRAISYRELSARVPIGNLSPGDTDLPFAARKATFFGAGGSAGASLFPGFLPNFYTKGNQCSEESGSHRGLSRGLSGFRYWRSAPSLCVRKVPRRTLRALITQAVDERNLAALRGNTRPEATAQNDRGAVADGFAMEHLLLQLRRAPEQEAALQRYLDEVQDPTSANFHKWLTAEQFGQQFGVAQQDLDTITRWLESHGFSVNLVYPNRMVIDFSGTVGQRAGRIPYGDP